MRLLGALVILTLCRRSSAAAVNATVTTICMTRTQCGPVPTGSGAPIIVTSTLTTNCSTRVDPTSTPSSTPSTTDVSSSSISSSSSSAATCSPTHIPINAELSNTGFQYLGCYVDDSERIMYPEVVILPDSNSPLECIKYCTEGDNSGRRYPYAGLQNGAECWCSYTLQSREPADKKRALKYPVVPPKWEDIEGWEDTYTSTPIPIHSFKPKSTHTATPTHSDIVARRGEGRFYHPDKSPHPFPLSRSAAQRAKRALLLTAAPVEECSMPCTGNSPSTGTCNACGSAWRMDVYFSPSRAETAPRIQQSSYEYVYEGCYNNVAGGAAAVLGTQDSYTDSTGFVVDDCVAHCRVAKTEGGMYDYAGVVGGDTCYCGDSISEGSGKVNERECDAQCDDPNGSNLFCGGGSSGPRVQVYELLEG